MPKTRINIPLDRPVSPDDLTHNQRATYRDLLDCPNIALYKKSLLETLEKFEKQESVVKKVIQTSHSIFRQQPLLTAFLLWTKTRYTRSGLPNYATILLENELIPFRNEYKDLLIIQDLDMDHLMYTLEQIRCRNDFEIGTRESLVQEFVNFFDWLSKTTLYAIMSIEDPDKTRTRRRLLAHGTFTALLEKLDDRCRLVAKLLYFGESRTLEQVLTLPIKNVGFDKHTIRFGTQLISYPLHVFGDIRSLVGNRSSGGIFVGRQQAPMSPVTVFRNFKIAASQIGLGDSFSPKTLTTDLM